MFYLAFFIIYSVYLFKNRIPSKLGFAIQLIPMVLIVIFRFGYGADYFSYALAYDTISGSDFSQIFKVYTSMEKGFKYIIHISKLVGLSYQQFLILINSLMLFIYMIPVYKYSEDRTLSVLMFYSMFFFVWILSGIRQGLSMAISILLLINYLKSDKRYSKTDIVKNILLFLIAVSIHKASLYVIVLFLISKINWNKKSIITIFGLSLIFSHFQIVLFVIKRIPFLADSKTLVYYLSGSVNVFDFPGLVRIILFLIVIYLYDKITQEQFYKKITDLFLVGTTVYFMLKFSELTAARTHIYVFILLLLIIPYALKQIDFDNKLLIKIFIIIPMFLFFNKELIAMDSQSGLYQSGIVKKFPTKYNRSYYEFDSRGAFRLGLKASSEEEKNKFKKEINLEFTDYSTEDVYTSVSGTIDGKAKNFLINQHGKILEGYMFDYPIEFANNVVRYFENSGDPTTREHVFVDITGEKTSRTNLIEKFNEGKKDIYSYDKAIEKTTLSIEEFSGDINKIFTHSRGIQEVTIYEVEKPYLYYSAVIKYDGILYYAYFDNEKNMMFDNIYTRPSEFDIEGFIRLNTHVGTKIYSSEGKLIWWQ